MAPAAGTPSTGTKSRYADPPLPRPLLPLRSARSRAPPGRHHLPAPLPRPCVACPRERPRLAARPVPRGRRGWGSQFGAGGGTGPTPRPRNAPHRCMRGRAAAPRSALGLVRAWCCQFRTDAVAADSRLPGSEATEAGPGRQGEHERLPARGRGGYRPGNRSFFSSPTWWSTIPEALMNQFVLCNDNSLSGLPCLRVT